MIQQQNLASSPAMAITKYVQSIWSFIYRIDNKATERENLILTLVMIIQNL